MNISSSLKAALCVAPGRAEKAGQTVKPLDGDAVLERVGDYFEKWDADDSGTISWTEIRKCVADPSIEGEEAVTLASLRGLLEHDADFRGKKIPAPVSLDRIYDISFEYDTEEVEQEFGRPVLEALYEKFASKTAPQKAELFTSELPEADDIRQGVSPSCGFLSVTYAQVTKDPQSVRDAVQQISKDKIRVRFPGFTKAIEMRPLTPTERLISASSGEGGSWLPTLEKAWGIHLAKGRPEAAFEMTTYPEEAIKAWTNHPAVTADLPAKSSDSAFAEFLGQAEQTLRSGGMAVAWTKQKGISEKDFVVGHAYTVTGVDRESGLVSLRNPWGRMEPTSRKGKAKDGRDDGKFTLTFKEFQANFKSLAQSEPEVSV